MTLPVESAGIEFLHSKRARKVSPKNKHYCSWMVRGSTPPASPNEKAKGVTSVLYFEKFFAESVVRPTKTLEQGNFCLPNNL